MTKTLLAKAKGADRGRRANRAIGREESELVVAWVRGEITSRQAGEVLGISPNHAHTMLSQWLVKGVRANLIDIMPRRAK